MKNINVIQSRIKTFSKVLKKFPDVKYVGDPVLRQVAKKATLAEGIKIGKKIGDVIIKYRKIAGYGRGFAAPQIGISKSVFATFVDGKIQIFINPKISKYSKPKNYYRELCLSSGIFSADVKRPEWIEMKWTGVDGKTHQEKFDGFLARLYQHEEAHLRGIVNIDVCEHGGIEICTFDPLKEQLRTS